MRAAAAVLATALALAAVVPGAWPAAAPAARPAAPPGPVDNCLTCHLDQGTPAAKSFRADVHFKAGVTCAGCHGGDPAQEDPEQAMNRARGFLGKPQPGAIPEMCGKCHGSAPNPMKAAHHLDDVLGAFSGSAHAAALRASPEGPQCVSCHGVHAILAVRDPASPVFPTHVTATCARCHSNPGYMKAFNPSLPVDQYSKYLTSVHGQRNAKGDPRVATCVSCHSNHAVLKVKDPRSPVYPTRVPETCGRCHADPRTMAGYGIPTDQLADYRRSAHGVALLKNSDLGAPACNSCHGNHGAAPPGVGSVENVCGTCHAANQELYDKSPHRPAFTEKHLPGCVVCHGSHKVPHPTDAMLGFGSGSACVSCHQDLPGDRAAAAIHRSRAALDSLTAGRAEAESTLARAEQLGMDVEEARYSLKSVNQAVVETRVQVHAFDPGAMVTSAAPGIRVISAAKLSGLAAIREYHFRRQGLAVATLIITALVLLLYLKIRQIERRRGDENR